MKVTGDKKALFEYDELNRNVKEIYEGDQNKYNITYTYDQGNYAIGKLTKVVDISG